MSQDTMNEERLRGLLDAIRRRSGGMPTDLMNDEIVEGLMKVVDNLSFANDLSMSECRERITEVLEEYYTPEEIEKIANQLYDFVVEEKRRSHSSGIRKGVTLGVGIGAVAFALWQLLKRD